jgi:prepilin-type N-terminal cleavage/methylation domain-containing protein
LFYFFYEEKIMFTAQHSTAQHSTAQHSTSRSELCSPAISNRTRRLVSTSKFQATPTTARRRDVISTAAIHAPQFFIHVFTLIEMLVVIAIIAILAAMLMPSLMRAREQAVSVSCANQNKQITMAITLYAGSANQALPTYKAYQLLKENAPGKTLDESTILWGETLTVRGATTPVTVWTFAEALLSRSGVLPVHDGEWVNYWNDFRPTYSPIWSCPAVGYDAASERKKTYGAGIGLFVTNSGNHDTSPAGRVFSIYRSQKITALKSPSSILMNGCASIYNRRPGDGGSDLNIWASGYLRCPICENPTAAGTRTSSRHLNGAQYGLADGSVRWYTKGYADWVMAEPDGRDIFYHRRSK